MSPGAGLRSPLRPGALGKAAAQAGSGGPQLGADAGARAAWSGPRVPACVGSGSVCAAGEAPAGGGPAVQRPASPSPERIQGTGPPSPRKLLWVLPTRWAQGELCGPQAPPPPSPLGRLRVARGLGVLLCHRPVIHHAATPRAVPRAPGSCPACFSLITRESSQIFKHAAFLQEFPCWVLWAFYNGANGSSGSSGNSPAGRSRSRRLPAAGSACLAESGLPGSHFVSRN